MYIHTDTTTDQLTLLAYTNEDQLKQIDKLLLFLTPLELDLPNTFSELVFNTP